MGLREALGVSLPSDVDFAKAAREEDEDGR